jgi:hypothetical protein
MMQKKGNRRVLAWALYIVAIPLLIGLALTPLSREIVDTSGAVTEIKLTNPRVFNGLMLYSLFCFFALLIVSLVGFAKKTVPLPGLALALALLGFPLALGSSLFQNRSGWMGLYEATTPSGQTYVLAASLAQNRIALAHVGEQSWRQRHLQIIGQCSAEASDNHVLLIRADKTSQAGQLILVNDTLIGLPHDNHCYLAYDLSNETFYSDQTILSLSPYLCLGPDDTPLENDVQGLTRALQETDADSLIWQTVEAGLTHTNPKVREIAEELLKIQNRN